MIKKIWNTARDFFTPYYLGVKIWAGKVTKNEQVQTALAALGFATILGFLLGSAVIVGALWLLSHGGGM